MNKAIEQYKIYKDVEAKSYRIPNQREEMLREVQIIKENFPKSEWTVEQMAKVKAWDDGRFQNQFNYDFQDDYDNSW